MLRFAATTGTFAATALIALFLIAATVLRSFLTSFVAIRIHADRSTHESYGQSPCHHYCPTLHL